ncbi:MAG: hypothetical protein KJ663_02140, partial [Proteobacteria bacterium]|nr:hypothetical protein [Pseudomonadota bacterium]
MNSPLVRPFCTGFSTGHGLLQCALQRRFGLQQLRLFPFFRLPDGIPGDWIVNLTVTGLIVLGGIGFIVQHEVIAWYRGLQKRLSLHTKLVLLTTECLQPSDPAGDPRGDRQGKRYTTDQINTVRTDACILREHQISLSKGISPPEIHPL